MVNDILFCTICTLHRNISQLSVSCRCTFVAWFSLLYKSVEMVITLSNLTLCPVLPLSIQLMFSHVDGNLIHFLCISLFC